MNENMYVHARGKERERQGGREPEVDDRLRRET